MNFLGMKMTAFSHQSIVHCQFVLQMLNLLGEFLDEHHRIKELVDGWLNVDAPHADGKAQRGYRLLNLGCLAPDVGDELGVAVAA